MNDSKTDKDRLLDEVLFDNSPVGKVLSRHLSEKEHPEFMANLRIIQAFCKYNVAEEWRDPGIVPSNNPELTTGGRINGLLESSRRYFRQII